VDAPAGRHDLPVRSAAARIDLIEEAAPAGGPVLFSFEVTRWVT
jgi:hypothetical protein